jgi:DNA primase
MNAYEAVKNAVPVEGYARTLTELRPEGLRLVGRCPIPTHNDRTPSFHVWPESRSWWCFGACARGGDVITLCQAVEGGEPWEAMMTLAIRFEVDLPERPKSWRDWQDTKAHRRHDIKIIRAEFYQRRIFRFFFADAIAAIEDPNEREEEARRVWDRIWPAAWGWAQ